MMTLKSELKFGSKIEGIDYKDRPGVYALILNNDRKIAIIKSGDRYFLPGGGIEGDESHEDCLIRECHEELGYEIYVGEYIGTASQYLISYKTKEPLKIIGHFYYAKLRKNTQNKIEEDHELMWISHQEAISKMYVEFQAWGISKLLRNQS